MPSQPIQFCQPTRLEWPWRVAFTAKPGTKTIPARWYLVRVTSPSKLAADANEPDHTKCVDLGPHEYDNDAETEALLWVEAINEQLAVHQSVIRSWGLSPIGIEWNALRLPSPERPKKGSIYHSAPGGIYTILHRHTFLFGKYSTASLLEDPSDGISTDIICIIKRGRIAEWTVWEDPTENDQCADDPTELMLELIGRLKEKKKGIV